MSSRHILSGPNIALIAVFAAFIAASTLVPEVTLAFGVPFSLQTLAVVLAGLCLGPWRGAAAVTLYVVVGAAGLPIYANNAAGLAILAGPTGGFLVGFIPAAWLVGYVAVLVRKRIRLSLPALIIAGLVSIPVVYAVGIPWLSQITGLTLGQATVAMSPFMIGDAIKVVIAASLASIIHRAYPQLMPANPVQKTAVDVEEAATA
ncbi:biotin transporter BioY [Demequina sp. B12]|uniref:biotin transporter BioY n=1 Tax=Demequina sp. B12 TaxID=2992757 RepID=UPI00237BABF1|nr:biotin transporter BioY [Demequina sp. B12]MDE0573229.1 biotin transporter BioY [Demequina sp. B12]